MMKKTILVVEDRLASGELIAKILKNYGLQVTAAAPSGLPLQDAVNVQDIIDIVAVSRKETALKKLIWHHLTNLTRNLLGPLSTWNDVAMDRDLIVHHNLQETIPMMKQAAEQLYESLFALRDMEGMWGPTACNLLEAIRQSEKSYKASLLDSNISLKIDIDDNCEVSPPAYLISLVISNIIDNAKDAILKAEGKQGREIRIESYEESELIICHVANSGAIDGEDIPHIFEEKYSTKKYGRGMGLPLAVECLAIYGAELTLTAAGPPETVFSLKLEKPPTINPTRETANRPKPTKEIEYEREVDFDS